MRYLKISVLCLFILSGFSIYSEAPKTPHPFNVHDLIAMDRILGQTVSPDGQWIAFTLRKTDLEANKGRTDLWLVGTNGKGLRQMTSNPAGDFNPCWSKDVKTIYFISTRSGSSQVWKISADGGEAVQVTKQPLDVGTGGLVVFGEVPNTPLAHLVRPWGLEHWRCPYRGDASENRAVNNHADQDGTFLVVLAFRRFHVSKSSEYINSVRRVPSGRMVVLVVKMSSSPSASFVR